MKSDDMKKAICYHEFGHWFTASHLGFGTGNIKIKVIKDKKYFGHKGSSKVFPRLNSNSTDSIDIYLKNRISILFSGVISQTLSIESRAENTARDLLKTDGADDYKSITELFYIFRGVRYSEQKKSNDDKHISELQDECWAFANKIINENQDTISYMVTKMKSDILKLNTTYTFTNKKLNQWLTER